MNSSVSDVYYFLENLALTRSLYKCSCHFRRPVHKSVPFSFKLICLYPWWSNPILAFPVISAPLCFLFLWFFSTDWHTSLRYLFLFLTWHWRYLFNNWIYFFLVLIIHLLGSERDFPHQRQIITSVLEGTQLSKSS